MTRTDPRTTQELNSLTRDQLVREVQALELSAIRAPGLAANAYATERAALTAEVARLETAVVEAHAEIARLSKALEAAHAAQGATNSAEIGRLRAQVAELKNALGKRKGEPRADG